MADDLTSKEYTPQELKDAFVKMYGGNEAEVRLYSSPARINIIGEHIDYNGGKFFPGSYEFDVNQTFVYDKANDYANYLNGILQQLKGRNFKFECETGDGVSLL